MSPEQCQGENLDERSDIYSMGAVLYEALVGVPPLLGPTPIDTMQMHVSLPPPAFAEIRTDLNIHPKLEAVTLKALEKRPEDRYPSMEKFGEALSHVAKLIESDRLKEKIEQAAAEPKRTDSSVMSTVDIKKPVVPISPDSRARVSLVGLPAMMPSEEMILAADKTVQRKSGGQPIHKTARFKLSTLHIVLISMIVIFVIAALIGCAVMLQQH